ncbi:MAG TPA: 30S ribosomal protein S6, partial [Candidatus Sulfomarinibacteraceae bacterium]|nr:30S ribosomal protein S6 [Candidatus Sulfomarinibacteraceae bacterium]
MPLYEMGIIVDPEVAPEEETAALERLEAIITAADGTIVDKDARGRRQLAYPIKKKNYGVYHFWTFEVGGDVLDKLNFELRTN